MVSTIAVLTIVAVLLLSSGLWSPIGELLGVAVITAGCLAAQRPAVQARLAAWARPGWQALLRHIPGDRTGAARGGAHLSRGRDRERRSAAPHAEAEARAMPGNGRAPAAPRAEGEPPGPGSGRGRRALDAGEAPGTGAAELAGAESAAGTGTAGPTEVTTPLPAIHD